jgi:hypothetical protein
MELLIVPKSISSLPFLPHPAINITSATACTFRSNALFAMVGSGLSVGDY